MEENHEVYVSFETAKLLKEAGFNWTCTKNYMGEVGYPLWTTTKPGNLNDESKVHKGWKSAPSLAVAQRWIRETFGIEVQVTWGVQLAPERKDWSNRHYTVDIAKDEKYFGDITRDTYEEALEAGINKCLKDILSAK